MVISEARSPVGSAQQSLEGAGQIDETVQHEEEHGQERGQDVDVAQQDAQLANDCQGGN